MVNWLAPVVVAFGEMEEMLGPVTEMVVAVIAPDGVMLMPDDKDDWPVLKNPMVVDTEANPET